MVVISQKLKVESLILFCLLSTTPFFFLELLVHTRQTLLIKHGSLINLKKIYKPI